VAIAKLHSLTVAGAAQELLTLFLKLTHLFPSFTKLQNSRIGT